MARERSVPTVFSIPQLTWKSDGQYYEAIDVEMVEGQTQVVAVSEDGDARLFDVLDVYRAANRNFDPVDAAASLPVIDPEWTGVSFQERDRCERRFRDLTHMCTGDPLGDIRTGNPRPGFIDPDFDPELPMGVRVELMAKRLARAGEAHCSPVTLQKQLAKIRLTGDPRTLAHGNHAVDRLGLDQLPDGVAPVFLAYGQSTVNASDMTLRAHIARFRRWAKKEGQRSITSEIAETIGGLTEAQVTRLLERHCPELKMRAKQRRSQAIRTPESQGRFSATAPYQVIEVDATPIDLLAVDQYGKLMKRLQRVSAVDTFTKKTLAFAYTERLGSDAVRSLLWLLVSRQLVHPSPLDHGGSGAPQLPQTLHVLPGIQIQDRGSEYNNKSHFATAAGIEMVNVTAPPGRGDKKPHVESSHRGIALLWQQLPGSVGSDVSRRGRHVEKGPLLRIDQILALETAYIEGVVHNTHHSGLRHVRYPGRKMTPNEFENLYYANGGVIGVDPEPYRALHFLEAEGRVFNPAGIRLARRTYRLPAREFAELGYVAGDPVTVYFQEHTPTHIIVQHRRTRVPFVIPDIALNDPAPPLADAIDIDYRRWLLGGGATADRGVDELKQQLVELAHSLAQPIPKAQQRTATSKHAAADNTEPQILDLMKKAMGER
jgi:hypothetical protein